MWVVNAVFIGFSKIYMQGIVFNPFLIIRREPYDPEVVMKLRDEMFSIKSLPPMNLCCVHSSRMMWKKESPMKHYDTNSEGKDFTWHMTEKSRKTGLRVPQTFKYGAKNRVLKNDDTCLHFLLPTLTYSVMCVSLLHHPSFSIIFDRYFL